MERGDEASSIIFEKLGWGLWGAKRVTPESFESEREVMNKLNAKVKDNASNRNEKSKERKLSGGASGGPVIKTSPPPVMYIDENVLQTDEDEEYDENDDMRKQGGGFKHQMKIGSSGGNTNSTMYVYTGSGRRRPSAVVYDTTNDPELANERELLAQKVRSAHKSTQASSLRRLSVGSPHPSVNESIASSSYSNQSSRDNVWDIDGHDKSNTASTSSTTNNNNTTNNNTNTLNERLSRRSSRLSVSKESGIRSTLSPLRNRKLVYRMDNNTNNTNSSSNTSNSNFRIDQELDPPHVYSGGGSSSAIASDTDEEDWARIGAASLLRSRSGSVSMSVSVSPGIPPTAATAAVNNVGTADATVKSRSMSWTQTEPARAVVQQQLQQQQQQPPPPPPLLLQPPLKSPFTSNSDDDTNETARLLLSLK